MVVCHEMAHAAQYFHKRFYKMAKIKPHGDEFKMFYREIRNHWLNSLIPDQEEMEKSYYWMDRENKFLQYLNRSLEMIEEGTFGICKTCGELIGKERLEEVPHTSKCFKCKSQTV